MIGFSFSFLPFFLCDESTLVKQTLFLSAAPFLYLLQKEINETYCHSYILRSHDQRSVLLHFCELIWNKRLSFSAFSFFFVLPSLLQRWRRMEAVVMAEIEMRLTVGVTSTWSTLRPCGSVGALSGSEFLMALPNWTWHTTHMKADQCREGNIKEKSWSENG